MSPLLCKRSTVVVQLWLKLVPSSVSQVFLPGFLSSNLYYKYLNDLIHSVRGDEFPGGTIALSIHGPGSSPDSDSVGGPDGSASQVWVLGFDSVGGNAVITFLYQYQSSCAVRKRLVIWNLLFRESLCPQDMFGLLAAEFQQCWRGRVSVRFLVAKVLYWF